MHRKNRFINELYHGIRCCSSLRNFIIIHCKSSYVKVWDHRWIQSIMKYFYQQSSKLPYLIVRWSTITHKPNLEHNSNVYMRLAMTKIFKFYNIKPMFIWLIVQCRWFDYSVTNSMEYPRYDVGCEKKTLVTFVVELWSYTHCM